MTGKIIYWAGVVLAILGCLDIWRSKHPLIERIIFIVLLLATSWLGIVVHYLYGKNKL